MPTHAVIAMETPESIFCRCDGYPAYTGRTLVDFYQAPEKVADLIALGAIESIEELLAPVGELAPSRYFWIDEMVRHSSDTPQEGVIVAGHRDGGEDLKIEEWNDRHELFFRMWEIYEADYAYLFSNGRWIFTGVCDEEWEDVAEYLRDHPDC